MTAILVDLERTTKVGEKDNDCFVQHPSHLEVGEKSGHGTVEDGQEAILHLREIHLVGIPVSTSSSGEVARRTKSLHDGHSGLDRTM